MENLMTEERVDVLVIGAGIGGMCAAAFLAHKGYRTLVVEALPRIGGHCSTIEYKGIKCTAGVVGPGTGGALEEVCREVGAEYEIRRCGPPHYLIDGKVVEVPAKGGLRALLSASGAEPGEVERVLKAFSKAMTWATPSESINMREWLLQHSNNECIFDIFNTMAAATAFVGIDHISAGAFFLYLRKLAGFREWGVCPEGSIALPNALAKAVEKYGGQIWTGSPAIRIHSQDGVVKGATVHRNGEDVEVRASVVMSNCGPKRTVGLVGRENFDRGYLADLQKLTPSRVISIHIKSDAPLIDYEYLLVVGARRINALFQLTAVCPELAPPGTHYLVAGADPVGSLGPSDTKAELDLCMQDLRELLPGLESHGEVLMTGAFHGEWPAMFSTTGQSMSQQTPIVNLYAIGDGFLEPGMTAVAGAAESGLLAAKDAARRLGAGA